jgi:branched-chain amino acid transport system permease protein
VVPFTLELLALRRLTTAAFGTLMSLEPAFALLIGLVVLRTRSHAFVIITIAVLLSFQLLAANLKPLTGGTEGLTLGAPGWPEEWGNTPYFYMFYAILLLTLALAAFLMSSRLGAGLVAIRNDEGKAASIGVNTTTYKTIANVLSALPFGAAGVIYGQYLSFVNPSGAFSILTSVYLVLAALVGGRGTLWGPVLGGFIVALANEGATVAAGGVSARVLIMGLVLVLTVMFLPAGLLPTLTGLMTRRRASRSTVKYIDQAAIARHDSHLDITSLISRGSGQPTGGTAVLEVRDVVKRFGPNGSGKTTLFNCLTGTVRPDKGTVLLDGEDVTSDKVWTRAHGGLGRTFQVTRLFRSMTVLDNLVAPLERTSARQMVAGRYSGEEVDRARDILGFMGLQEFEKQSAAALSFGQQKLVELAQVLMLRPSVVLLDEPASGINPTLIEKLTKVIRQLNEAGTTVLIVEHNIPLVLGLCDTVHVLAGGKILTSGTPDVIRNDPLVIEAYLGPDHLLEAPRG